MWMLLCRNKHKQKTVMAKATIKPSIFWSALQVCGQGVVPWTSNQSQPSKLDKSLLIQQTAPHTDSVIKHLAKRKQTEHQPQVEVSPKSGLCSSRIRLRSLGNLFAPYTAYNSSRRPGRKSLGYNKNNMSTSQQYRLSHPNLNPPTPKHQEIVAAPRRGCGLLILCKTVCNSTPPLVSTERSRRSCHGSKKRAAKWIDPAVSPGSLVAVSMANAQSPYLSYSSWNRNVPCVRDVVFHEHAAAEYHEAVDTTGDIIAHMSPTLRRGSRYRDLHFMKYKIITDGRFVRTVLSERSRLPGDLLLDEEEVAAWQRSRTIWLELDFYWLRDQVQKWLKNKYEADIFHAVPDAFFTSKFVHVSFLHLNEDQSVRNTACHRMCVFHLIQMYAQQ